MCSASTCPPEGEKDKKLEKPYICSAPIKVIYLIQNLSSSLGISHSLIIICKIKNKYGNLVRRCLVLEMMLRSF